MRVLFISRGVNDKPKIIVENQAKSLISKGIEVEFFLINSNGFSGYFKSIKQLKILLQNKNYDVIHAHYSFSAYVASIAGAKPLVVSLMGSDIKKNFWGRLIIYFFISFFSWRSIITKSKDSQGALKSRSTVVPNGVDIELFIPMDKILCQEKLGWNTSVKHILFAADPNRPEKNFNLANNALSIVNRKDCVLHFLRNVPYSEMVYWYNAADVVLLTSKWEGSPNVIKEAMACNRPIITTGVGDVNQIIGDTKFCHVVNFSSQEVANRLIEILSFDPKQITTNGREKLFLIGYDSNSIANKLIDIYKAVI